MYQYDVPEKMSSLNITLCTTMILTNVQLRTIDYFQLLIKDRHIARSEIRKWNVCVYEQ